MLKAAIFDLDGLLIDSEPLWQRVELSVFGRLGLSLSPADCEQTTGLRVDEVVSHWRARRPWSSPSVEAVADQIVREVIELIRSEGEAKPGASEAIEAARSAGLRLGLASSSAPSIIEAALERLGLASTFEVVRSALDEPYGKPHPAVYLAAAAGLSADPRACVALEDSLNGVIAAKAARMAVIAVPDASAEVDRGRFAVADAVVDSLLQVDGGLFETLARAGARGPTSSITEKGSASSWQASPSR